MEFVKEGNSVKPHNPKHQKVVSEEEKQKQEIQAIKGILGEKPYKIKKIYVEHKHTFVLPISRVPYFILENIQGNKMATSLASLYKKVN